jgi:hypothetical protein
MLERSKKDLRPPSKPTSGGSEGEMMRHKYIIIRLHGGRSYVQPADKLNEALDGELDGVNPGEKITLDLQPTEMTEDEYVKLPPFEGH